jgi:uncharacterized membrane protein HdeD (DUF308 family)
MKNIAQSSDPFSAVSSLEHNWWVFALRGALSILFGILALMMPAAALMAMTLVFGAYALIDGVLFLTAGLRRVRAHGHWGGLVLSGILGIATGLIVFILPQIATIGLMAFLWGMIAFWATLIGVFEITSAIRLRREIQGEWLLALCGALSLALGIGMMALLWMDPLGSLISLGFVIGIYALISGCMVSWLAMKLYYRQRKGSFGAGTAQPA